MDHRSIRTQNHNIQILATDVVSQGHVVHRTHEALLVVLAEQLEHAPVHVLNGRYARAARLAPLEQIALPSVARESLRVRSLQRSGERDRIGILVPKGTQVVDHLASSN